MKIPSDLDVYAPPLTEDGAPRAVYLHVPFCLHRCGYCDFTLVADQDDLIPAYLESLGNELSRLDRQYEVDTIFIGGGTPTHLSVTQLARLFDLISQHFCVADGGEFSIEANPDGLDDDRLQVLKDCGVNRISLGVQSFDHAILKTLERTHSPDEARNAVERAAKILPNVSLDLIFGVPGQSEDSWRTTLQSAVELPIRHVSTYGLTFEKGTDFFRRLRTGSLTACADADERDMYSLAMQVLRESDFHHYEISNFARPHFKCAHNLTYWRAQEYFGFGPGAARYVNGVRSTNARHVGRWVEHWRNHRVALQDYEALDAASVAREAIFLGLRQVDGIHCDTFRQRFGMSPESVDPDAVAMNAAKGWLETRSGHMRLTQEGRFFADSVVSDFL